jgi:glycosyltransferase involved in cell wall biosynthesis
MRGGTVTLGAYASRALQDQIAAWSAAAPFDAVYAFGGAMAPIALTARARRRVLDLCDADSEKWLGYAGLCESGPCGTARVGTNSLLRAVYAREGRRLRELELSWLDAFDAVTVVTRREARVLDRAGVRKNLHVLSNAAPIIESAPSASRSRPIVSFTGALDYKPNVDGLLWFVRDVWPIVRRQAPASRLRIAGRTPVRGLRQVHGNNGVEVIADVPSITPYVLASRVAIAPMRISRGLPNKVLEAMGAARPVVATPAVGESLEARNGEGILVADATSEFAEEVVRLLRDDNACDRVGESGQAYVRAHHGLDVIHTAWRGMLLDAGMRESGGWGGSADRPITMHQSAVSPRHDGPRIPAPI